MLQYKTLTMMDDAILQQSLSQIDPFFWFAYLPNFFQPRNKLTGKKEMKFNKWN